jgi:hypothetical protein
MFERRQFRRMSRSELANSVDDLRGTNRVPDFEVVHGYEIRYPPLVFAFLDMKSLMDFSTVVKFAFPCEQSP